MRADRREQVESLFEAALERPAAERAAWLAGECGGDEGLRKEVAALLAAHERAGGLLDGDLLDPAAMLDARTPYYEWVGPYRILGEIGRGGMGIVYHAEDTREELPAAVAIKLLGASRYSPKTRQRFERERRILAALRHPNIARLLDAGLTEDGVPYLVIEFVPGLPIDEYCLKANLAIADRLRLFRRVARAVHAAHAAHVVHRDLKPSNVLVLADGTPKLLDFGIAKIIASADPELSAPLTESGALILTPAYASPEQVTGDPITAATDVYGLGVLLYQLLTGRLPLTMDGRDLGEMIGAILDDEPAAPSAADYPPGWPPPFPATSDPDPAARLRQFRRYLADQLDEIVMTALAKQPERRQASAKRLAEEIESRL